MARRLTRLAAALFTPLVVLSSAHELYLRNQQDLDRTLSVLRPFWLAAAAAAGLTLLLQAAGRRGSARAALCGVYTAGLAFTGWTFLRALPAGDHFVRWVLDTGPGAAVFAAAWLAATMAVARGAGPRALEPIVAVLAAVFVAHDAAAFATRLDRRPDPPPRDLATAFGAGGDPSRPNVYHVLLDGLPDDLVEACWPASERAVLDGFVRFHVRSTSRVTRHVLPSIFAGRPADGGDDDARLRVALTGEASLLDELRRAGYRRIAFVPRFAYEKQRDAFDLTVFHDDNARAHDMTALHAAVFRRLWVSSTLPDAVTRALGAGTGRGLRSDFFRAADVERLSSHVQPIVSHLSMESVLDLEPRLPARGRYTYVHLLLPHNPYVLRSDCTYAGPSSSPVPTDLREQTACALLLVGRLLDALQRLGRLDASVVLVHGDHGSGEDRGAGRLSPDDAWLRTALLVKPAGARGPLRVARALARPVDVAPTLLAALGVSTAVPREGRVLEEALSR